MEAPVDVVWDELLDVDQIVTCVPGAEIFEKVSDDEYNGRIKLKVGPLTLNLEGAAVIESRDAEARVIILKGKGKDTQGKGSADVSVVARISDAGDGKTRVAIEQELRVTGRIAQFGRGIMKDVSQRLSQEFARCLEARITATAPAGRSAPRLAPAPAHHRSAQAVSGIRLMLWGLWRALLRVLRRLMGRGCA